MKPICLIAARGNSKGVPKKNIRLLANKPLIAHTIESCINSNIFSNVIVSTENNEIANIAKKYGAEVPFLRPKRLATDSASMNDVFLHVIPKLMEIGYNFDIMVNRDCTVPFIQNSDITGSIKLLKQKKCDLVCGVYRQHHNPYFNMMELNENKFLKFSKKPKKQFVTRQKSPIVYQLNGLFTFYVSQFMKYRKLYMPKILPYEIPPETGLMIDTEFEFQIANMIATKQIKI
jgi:CMP-N,N'-diacetyllegionaminic acid synthase